MKNLLLTTIAAVVLVGCGQSQSPEPPTAKAADISIHEAVKTGNTEAVKQHLAAGTDVNAKVKSGLEVGMTPLHWAADEGHKEIVELLITAGADVDAKDLWMHYTALHFAASAGHNDIVELLIAKGANVNAKTKIGITPLATASQQGQTEMADFLRKHGGKTRAELWKAAGNQTNPLHYLSAFGLLFGGNS